MDVSWGDAYPEDLPCISLDAFYNKLMYAYSLSKCLSNILCDDLVDASFSQVLRARPPTCIFNNLETM